MDRSESLTANFYAWEMRGRGWMLWDEPVDIEPTFFPFFYHDVLYPVIQDKGDGRRHSSLSWVVSKISQLIQPTPQEQEFTVPEEPPPYSPPQISSLVELSVHLPKNWKGRAEAFHQFLYSLATSRIPVSFEIIGTGSDIYLHFTTADFQAKWLYDQLYVLFPNIAIDDAHPKLFELFNPDYTDVQCVDYGLAQEFMRPITPLNPTAITLNIATALEGFTEGELGVFQVMTQGAVNPWTPSIHRSVSDGGNGSFFMDAPEMPRLAQEKTRFPLCATIIRTLVQTKNEYRTHLLNENMMKAVISGSRSQTNTLIPMVEVNYPSHIHAVDILRRQSRRYGMLLNTQELSSLIQFPTAQRGKLAVSQRTAVVAPQALQNNKTVLGNNIYLGKETPVSLSISQRLRHTHIIGATGTGKSTLLLNMMIQDVMQGKGVTLLDPHGDVADTILKYIPENRIKDVVIIDPSDSKYPVGINILAVQSEAEKIVLSGDLAAMFKRLSTSWGDQMDAILGNAVNVFLEHPKGGTLLELRMFLTDNKFRKKILSEIDDAYVKHFWEREFPMLRKNAVAPLLTRLDIFLRAKVIRNMMGQKKGLDFQKVINSNKILIIKLAQGLIGEANAYLLGTLITSKLYQAAQSRQTLDQDKRKPYFIYIDEFQNFITPSMESILSGARKFGLGLVLVHQDLQQLFKVDAKVGNSLISNAGTRICFRVGELDAQKLNKGFHHFEVADLQNLGVGEAIVRADRSDNDCNITTFLLPDIPENAEQIKGDIIAHTRSNYSNQTNVDKVFNYGGNVTNEKPEPKQTKESPKTKEPPKPKDPPQPEPKVEVKGEPKAPKSESKSQAEEPTQDIDEAAEAFKEKERKRAEQRAHTQQQEFIRKTAQDYGFKAIIEEATTNPVGRVDVGIRTDKLKIACEISVTTPPSYELKNIQKCLSNGYDIVVMCSEDAKHLANIKTLCDKELPTSAYPNVIFGDARTLVQLLNNISTQEKPQQKTVKGYRVKVKYSNLSEQDKTTQMKNLVRTILDAQRKNRDKK